MTIKDIAKEANVVISTVSNVINNKKHVKLETKKRVLDAVKKFNYISNLNAISLKTNKTLSIGVIVPDISNPFFPEIIRGIEDFLSKKRYAIVLCNTDEDKKKEEMYLNTFISKNVDGLIFIGTCRSYKSLNVLKNIPTIIVDRKVSNSGNLTVMIDNFKGGKLATSYLLESTHSSEILFLTGPLSISTYFDRMAGYIKAFREKGLQYNEALVIQCSPDYNGGYDSIKKLFTEKNKIKSIFAANDLIALGAIKALLEKNVKIPDDISIIGFDDIFISSIFIPALSTIKQPKYKMGKISAELLLKIINNKKINKNIILNPELVLRETTL